MNKIFAITLAYSQLLITSTNAYASWNKAWQWDIQNSSQPWVTSEIFSQSSKTTINKVSLYVNYNANVGSYISGLRLNSQGSIVPQAVNNSIEQVLYLSSTQRIQRIDFYRRQTICGQNITCNLTTQVKFTFQDKKTTATYPQNPQACTNCSYSSTFLTQTIDLSLCFEELKGIRAQAPTQAQIKAGATGIENLYYYTDTPCNPYCAGKFSKTMSSCQSSLVSTINSYTSTSSGTYMSTSTARKVRNTSLVIDLVASLVPLGFIVAIIALGLYCCKKHKVCCFQGKSQHAKTIHIDPHVQQVNVTQTQMVTQPSYASINSSATMLPQNYGVPQNYGGSQYLQQNMVPNMSTIQQPPSGMQPNYAVQSQKPPVGY